MRFGTLFVQLTLGMNAFITAQGFTTISMVSVLIGAICNITLDPVFIFAFHMGVKGAALATVISQAISTIWVVSFLCGKKTHLHLRKKYMRLEPKVFVPCVTLGLAAFIMQASESIVTVCFNSSLLRYGGDIAVGAMTILTSVMQFAMLPLQGIGQGAQPIMSYNYGARNIDRMKKTFKLHLVISLIYSTLSGSCPAFPGNLRGNLQLRSRTRFLYRRRSADLLRCDVPLWNPARLPDDLRCHRICGMLDHRGGCA